MNLSRKTLLILFLIITSGFLYFYNSGVARAHPTQFIQSGTFGPSAGPIKNVPAGHGLTAIAYGSDDSKCFVYIKTAPVNSQGVVDFSQVSPTFQPPGFSCPNGGGTTERLLNPIANHIVTGWTWGASTDGGQPGNAGFPEDECYYQEYAPLNDINNRTGLFAAFDGTCSERDYTSTDMMFGYRAEAPPGRVIVAVGLSLGEDAVLRYLAMNTRHVVPAPTCTSATPDNVTVSYNASTHEVFANGVTNANQVLFPTWSGTGGQDDIVWYSGVNQGGGTWKATINFSNHRPGNPDSGQFFTHVYLYDSALQPFFCDSANFTKDFPPPSPPSNPSSTCSADGTSVTLSWSPGAGADNYLLRVNNQTNDNPGCVDGWFCSDPPDKMINFYVPTSYTTSVTPGDPYRWWVHSNNSAGNSSAIVGTFTCTPPPTVTISADSTSIAFNTSTIIRWSSSNVSSCTVLPNGWTGTSGAQSTGNLTSSQTYDVSCDGGAATDSVIVNVGAPPPTLSVGLTVSPSSGTDPLTSTLTASVTGGTATGNVFYRFDCTNNGTYERISNLSSTTDTFNCTYSPEGPYTARVEMVREGITRTATADITVTAPIPSSPTVSITASPNPVVYNTSTTLTWTVGGGLATDCTASGGWSGGKTNQPGTWSESSGNLNDSSNTNFIITCTGPGGSDTDSIFVVVDSPFDLSISLSASPTSGQAPLGVSFTAFISDPRDALNDFYFWWNCTSGSIVLSTVISACGDPSNSAIGFQSLFRLPNTAFTSHTYTSGGNFVAKVLGKKSISWGEDRVPIFVDDPTLSVAISTDVSSGNVPLTVNITANTSGTATGTINYSFWWDCNNTGTNVAAVTSVCGDPTNPAIGAKFDGVSNESQSTSHIYSSEGTYFLKVIAERGTAPPDEDRLTITVDPIPNNPPVASGIIVTEPNYCTSGPAATIGWTYSDPDGDPQSAYQVQIDGEGSFATPEYDSGKEPCVVACSPDYTGTGILDFNTTYKARVRVWDSNDTVSSWVLSGSWKTPLHAYPNVDFTWAPTEPQADEDVLFTDSSTCRDINNNPVACDAWDWTFGDGGSSTQQTPVYAYSALGDYTIKLVVSDQSNFTCDRNKAISVEEKSPEIKEIPPSSMIQKAIARLVKLFAFIK